MPNFYSGHEMILNRINVFVFCRYYLEAIGYVLILTDCIIKKISYFLQIYKLLIEKILVIQHSSLMQFYRLFFYWCSHIWIIRKHKDCTIYKQIVLDKVDSMKHVSENSFAAIYGTFKTYVCVYGDWEVKLFSFRLIYCKCAKMGTTWTFWR